MTPSTLSELDQWMKDNCYANDSYAIGGRSIFEGYGIGRNAEGFYWYFTERGQQDIIATFATESEAVAFAFNQISRDKTAKRHLVGFIKEKSAAQELIAELQKRNIEFEQDEIPYGGIHDPRYRIFVFGCDHLQVKDLQEKFNPPAIR